jgi:hypothetical protein
VHRAQDRARRAPHRAAFGAWPVCRVLQLAPPALTRPRRGCGRLAATSSSRHCWRRSTRCTAPARCGRSGGRGRRAVGGPPRPMAPRSSSAGSRRQRTHATATRPPTSSSTPSLPPSMGPGTAIARRHVATRRGSGTGGIRTPGAFRLGRFQGGCIRPLCHRSADHLSTPRRPGPGRGPPVRGSPRAGRSGLAGWPVVGRPMLQRSVGLFRREQLHDR